MKIILHLLLLDFLFFSVSADTVEGKRIGADSLLRKIENSRKKIDSTLKRADEYFDSITGKSNPSIDTFSLIQMQKEFAEKERKEKQNAWLVRGGLTIVIIVAAVAWRKRKKR